MDQPPPTQTSETDEPANPQRRSILILVSAIILAFAVGFGASYFLWVRPLEARLQTAEENAEVLKASAEAAAAREAAAQEAAGQARNSDQQVIRYDVPVDDDPAYGSPEAPITVIEFSDYQCPFCQRWHLEVFPQIIAKYGDQVQLVYRDFPLDGSHPEARPAAEAANCANEQDKFWEFHDRLFSGEQDLSRQVYERYAQEVGLDMNEFGACLDEQRYAQEVQNDFGFASQLGVRSTPTFFINGLAVVGAQPFEVFEQIIDMELAGEIPQ